MGIIESLKGAWELASGLGSALSKMSALESKQAILDLQNLLGTIQGQAFELQRDNEQLRMRIRDLEEAAKVAADMFFTENVFWRRIDDEEREGPYCPACWELKKDKIHLTTVDEKGLFDCKVCQNRYRTAEYSRPTPVSRIGQPGWR